MSALIALAALAAAAYLCVKFLDRRLGDRDALSYRTDDRVVFYGRNRQPVCEWVSQHDSGSAYALQLFGVAKIITPGVVTYRVNFGHGFFGVSFLLTEFDVPAEQAEEPQLQLF